ncbi:glycosyltransferase [Streptomyces sp. HU2014]|uniref:Putative glycosyltransferase n=1 Tax=Streptomyces albireticuli TaxID=1940 RepID=A0A1Z2KZ78_9ACTN|nr:MULTISPECIES: macrolide family glycosyltransferase [Streptomyces]ARZ67330.1 putative glycosyltransferase [Streptomyces albireticuli]UQI47374.1 glycosyltransferase [Streptomyces sp. HU2014]
MAHIAFFILPVAGHVNPTLGVAEELVARGHRVTYALPEGIADRAVRVGADVVTYPLDKERFLAQMVPRQDADAYTDEGEFLRVLEWLLDMTRATLPLLEPHFAADRPDVIVNDPSSLWTGRLLADRWDIPVIRSTPTYAANEHWSLHPPVDSAEPPDDPELHELLARIGRLLEEEGAKGDLAAFTEVLHGGPALLYMPRSFQYAGDTFDDRHHFVGPCSPKAAFHGTWEPPLDGKPLVMVSLGTLYNERPEFFRTCVEAFRDEPWNIVLVLGGGLTPEQLGPVPGNVQVHDFVPHGDVLPHASLVVNHGGMSTAMDAFSHGVPVVAVPVMPEPRATARRITELGLGAMLLTSEVTAGTLRDTARRVLADPGVHDRLRAMGERIREAGGPAAAATAVEGLLPAGT